MAIPDDAVAQAVVIMEMVEARAAGVAFSCDPRTGNRTEMVINANTGLGESVVSGRIEPDEYRLSRVWPSAPVVISKHLGKRQESGPTADRHEQEETDGSATGGYALSEDNIRRLGLLLAAIDASLGASERPQDIEWAFDGSDFVILQARPVTALVEITFPALSGQPAVWSNANFRDGLPGVMCELFWGWAPHISDTAGKAPLVAAGYPVPAGLVNTRRFAGRAYLNLSHVHWMSYDAFGVSPGETNKLLGGHQPETPFPKQERISVRRLCRRAAGMLRFMAAMRRERRNAAKTFVRVKDSCDALSEGHRSLSDDELVDRLGRYGPFFADFSHRVGLIMAGSQTAFMTLLRLLKRISPGREITMANTLLTGMGRITSADQGYRLVALAEDARGDPDARGFLASQPFQPASWEHAIPDTSLFKNQFRAFLKEFGHRGVYEIDLSNPRWREDPSYLFDCITATLDTADLEAIRTRQKQDRERTLKEIDAKASWLTRYAVLKCAKAAVKAMELRERAKSELVRPEEGMRLLSMEIGRRFVDRGCLEEAEDIFHVNWFEIAGVVRKAMSANGLKVLVRDRKEERTRYLAVEPPDIIVGDTPRSGGVEVGVYAHEFAGLGVASGTASGKACLLFHPEEGSKLRHGGILVAPSTDPGWTPLFLRAKGIVVETGGIISHGAIVAREYGIPAVVNIPGITKVIKDGQRVTVNGDEGRVYVDITDK